MPQTATSGNCLAAGLNNALEVVAFDEANKAMVCDDFFVEPITAGGMASAWLAIHTHQLLEVAFRHTFIAFVSLHLKPSSQSASLPTSTSPSRCSVRSRVKS